jgi:preprotein translocase subunit SecG
MIIIIIIIIIIMLIWKRGEGDVKRMDFISYSITTWTLNGCWFITQIITQLSSMTDIK